MAKERSMTLTSNLQSAARVKIMSSKRMDFQDDILWKCGYESWLRLECIGEIFSS